MPKLEIHTEAVLQSIAVNLSIPWRAVEGRRKAKGYRCHVRRMKAAGRL